jgi:hypothetical protein
MWTIDQRKSRHSPIQLNSRSEAAANGQRFTKGKSALQTIVNSKFCGLASRQIPDRMPCLATRSIAIFHYGLNHWWMFFASFFLRFYAFRLCFLGSLTPKGRVRRLWKVAIVTALVVHFEKR